MAPAPTVGGRGPPSARPSGNTPSGAGRPSGPPGASAAHHKSRSGQDKRSELVCRVKYNNSLPDLPFDPKFITCPFGNSRFTNYVSTTLEQQMKYDFITEQDLGVHVDLILPDAYAQPTSYGDELLTLDPKDEKLLEDETPHHGDLKRSKLHGKIQSWMRKPDYISTEQTRYQPTTVEKVESRVGYAVRKKLGAEHNVYMDREAQIRAIEKTFEDTLVPITEHHSEKGVYPVEVLPVLPDGDMWKYPCAQVIFDSDPAPTGMQVKDQMEIMSQAMIRGVMDDSGEQFVAYFLPTDETRAKRVADAGEGKAYDEEAEYEYKMAREYNWNVKSKASKGYEENYFFIRREDGIYYNELETRVRLTKRRLRAGQQPSNSKLVVKHRPLNKNEHKMQRYRERHLEPPGEDDEELSEEEEELPETTQRSRSGSRSSSRSSRSGSRSKSRSRSPSGSRSRSRSASRSRSGSRSRSRSASPGSARSGSGSRSPSRSRSGSPASARSGSRSRSGSPASARQRSSSRSRSGSPASRSGSD